MTERIKIQGHWKDLSNFVGMIQERRNRIRQASLQSELPLPVNDLARKIHPGKLNLEIKKISHETKSIKTFQLIPDGESETRELPVFRAGRARRLDHLR